MPPTADTIRRSPLAWCIATLFGAGHFPFASGTVATAATIPIYLAGYYAGGDWAVLGMAVFFTVAGVWAADRLEKTLGYHDPSEAVVDEVAGFLITMLFLPLNLWTVLAGFVVFRALDILKPWPASRAEKLPGGWGIMADDVLCGVIGNLLLQAGVWIWK